MKKKPAKRLVSAKLLKPLLQTASLLLFLYLLGLAAFPLTTSLLPPSFFLNLDPLLAAGLPLAAREWLPDFLILLLPGFVVLLITLIFGRIFCGYICPFGSTLDLAHWIFDFSSHSSAYRQPDATKNFSQRPRRIKYLLLAILLAAAMAGVNLLFWAAPIPLITRFYALLLHPLALLGVNEAQNLALPLWQVLEAESLQYLQITLRRYNGIYFLLIFFGLLFVLEKLRPRFWCSCLCPAGALLGLFSLRPLWRRKVHGCIHCGKCAQNCPTGAIPSHMPHQHQPDAKNLATNQATAPAGECFEVPPEASTLHSECIACRKCVHICPVKAVSFAFQAAYLPSPQTESLGLPSKGALPLTHSLPDRRAFLASVGSGLLLAGVSYSGVYSPLAGTGRGSLWSAECVRPPGALPEADFMRLCIRCGACMKACPSNGLQPTWFSSGVEGMFSPVLLARRGPCEPDCNVCGQICPSRAIRPLPLEEKRWAKLGSAVVLSERCLAFSEGRRCVVCQEVCPYGAIKLVQPPTAGAQGLQTQTAGAHSLQMPEAAPDGIEPNTAPSTVPVPVVDPARCFGCGYCENHCPVRVPAIVVQPLGALRLAEGSYKQAGQDAGLRLEQIGTIYPTDYQWPMDGSIANDNLPPGFTDVPQNTPGELPPGFTE